MAVTDRLTPPDLAFAAANIRAFVQLMKREAAALGHPTRLYEETLEATHRRLEQQGLLTAVTLWPFWPHQFIVSK